MAEDRNPTTHIAFVLDRSGSMQQLRKVAIDGFNTQKKTLLAESGQENSPDLTMTVCTFNNTADFPFFLSDPSVVQDLNENLYVPVGGTAMYDAVAETIRRLEEGTAVADDYNSYLVIIISDGQENASKRTSRIDLAEKIQTMQNTGRWTFTYLGSNQDLAKVSEELNIPVGNMAKFEATSHSTFDAFQYTSHKLGTFLNDSATQNRNSRVYRTRVGAGASELRKDMAKSTHSTCNFYGDSGITDASEALKALTPDLTAVLPPESDLKVT